MSYKDLGFTNFLTRRENTSIQDTEAVASFKTPALPSSSITTPLSREKVVAALDDLVKITDDTTAISGTISDGTGVRIITTLSDRGNKARVMLGQCECVVYEDALSGVDNVVPYGSDTIANGTNRTMFYDYRSNSVSSSPKRGITYVDHVQNNTGSPHQYVFVFRWRYVGSLAL